MGSFIKYSDYYDLFYKDKDYKKEAEYIYKILCKYQKAPKHLLNLGCGTGNHDFNFVNYGLSVTAIDSSSKAIKIAKAKQKGEKVSEKKNQFIHGDIRNIKLRTKFDSVVALFHVVNYLNSNEDLLSCFNVVSKHLKKGGLFAFDSWYGPAVIHNLPEVRRKKIKTGDKEITRTATPYMITDANVAQIKFDFEIKEKGIKQFKEIHNMRFLFIPEIKLFCQLAGLELIYCSEWMTGRPLSMNSWYGLFICKKK